MTAIIIISLIGCVLIYIISKATSFHRENKNVYTADRAVRETNKNIEKNKAILKLNIYKDIRSQATSGKKELIVDEISERNLSYMSKEEFNDFIMEELKEKGYTVEKNEYRYDTETMKHYYKISW